MKYNFNEGFIFIIKQAKRFPHKTKRKTSNIDINNKVQTRKKIVYLQKLHIFYFLNAQMNNTKLDILFS